MRLQPGVIWSQLQHESDLHAPQPPSLALHTRSYNIIKVIGVNLATMTPSRGFSAELATGLTVSAHQQGC